MFKLLLKRAHI